MSCRAVVRHFVTLGSELNPESSNRPNPPLASINSGLSSPPSHGRKGKVMAQWRSFLVPTEEHACWLQGLESRAGRLRSTERESDNRSSQQVFPPVLATIRLLGSIPLVPQLSTLRQSGCVPLIRVPAPNAQDSDSVAPICRIDTRSLECRRAKQLHLGRRQSGVSGRNQASNRPMAKGLSMM